ncbi:MAG TPA: hypothetical protein VK914_01030 [bacterium]|jgi:hypothetical protein|nr:hypothetical protein [bacterium]
MVAGKSTPKTSNLELVLTAIPGETDLPRRIDSVRGAAARAGLKADMALVSETMPAGLSGIRHISAPPGHNSQAALLLASAESKAQRLLFLPGPRCPEQAVLRSLATKSGESDWIFASRGRVPGLAAFFEKLGAVPFTMDLGAPSIIRQKHLALIAPSLRPQDPFIAAHLVRAANAAGLRLEIRSLGESGLGLFEALGLDNSLIKARLKNRFDGLCIGAAMLAAGIFFKWEALTELLLFGTGILTLGYYFGKAE